VGGEGGGGGGGGGVGGRVVVGVWEEDGGGGDGASFGVGFEALRGKENARRREKVNSREKGRKDVGEREGKARKLTSSAAFLLFPAFPLSLHPIPPGVPAGLAIAAPNTGELITILASPPSIPLAVDIRCPENIPAAAPGTGTANEGGGVADV